jgi:quercetin dioxygenase-like cupin family protein
MLDEREAAMREIRMFEMEEHEPATVWRVSRPLVINVTSGQLWLTVEHDSEDYWLEAGQSCTLAAGMRAWVGPSRGTVRMTVTDADPHRVSGERSRRSWRPRWLPAA